MRSQSRSRCRSPPGRTAREDAARPRRALLERQIFDRDGESIYLTRFYVLGRPHSEGVGSAFDARGNPLSDRWPRLPVHIFLHKFHKGDSARELHNHPWAWAFSIVLAGGYREERRSVHPFEGGVPRRYRVSARAFPPLSINVLHAYDYHRVDLLEEKKGCWSIFVAGPRTQSWGFWNRDTGKFTPWREFVGLPPAA